MTNLITLDVRERSTFAGGERFGDTGGYERLSGRVHFDVDPLAPAQAGIVDLDKAPRDAQGLVRCTADFMLLRPADLARGNRRLFLDYGNRGNKRALQYFNDAVHSNDPRSLAHAGNGYFMRRGYAVAFIAWEGDLLPGDGRMVLDLPVCTQDGAPITGPCRVEYIPDGPGIFSFPLSGRAAAWSYPTASMDPASASLTKRRYQDDVRISIPPDEWCFARAEGGNARDTFDKEHAISPSDRHIYLHGGFQTGWIYELVYTAKDPVPMGLGHLVVRDFAAFLKYADADAAGMPNPLRGHVEKAYAWGRSQTGRCLRDFVYRGFNADEAGRRVFDGVLPHVAGAGRKWLNQRFSIPIVSGGQQYEDRHNIADSFPFAYAMSTDHLTGKADAILKRPETDPKVFHTQSATEYWQRRGSLAHTDTQGNDLAEPENVRLYFWSSSQHGSDPIAKAPGKGLHVHYSNIVSTSMLFRAMLDAMDAWVTHGTEPPASRIPRRADGTLVTMEEWRAQFPAIPGCAVPREPNTLPLLDFGPRAGQGILDREPPEVDFTRQYAVLVPAVDADGNDVAGVRAPMVGAPMGTYTGWNIRTRFQGEGAMFRFEGSYIPFPDSREERAATGDPRRAVAERYPDRRAYVAAVRAAAEVLAAQRLMLAEDVERAAATAENWGRPRHVTALD